VVGAVQLYTLETAGQKRTRITPVMKRETSGCSGWLILGGRLPGRNDRLPGAAHDDFVDATVQALTLLGGPGWIRSSTVSELADDNPG